MKIFLQGSWIEYDYDTLYNTLGVTETPSEELLIYSESHTLIEGWSNAGFNWIVKDTKWYPLLETPYFIAKKQIKELYKIGEPVDFPIFYRLNEDYLELQESFVKDSYLKDNLGYSETPSVVWGLTEGVAWSWFNPDTGLYWDNRQGKKHWVSSPPIPDQEDEPEILPFPDPVLPFEQWGSQVPSILSVTGRFNPSFEHPSLSPSYREIYQWEDYQNTFNLGLYINISKNNIKIYVVTEEGVEDYLGNHLSYGEHFIGDYECLYIEQGSLVSPRERIRSQSFYGDQDWRDLETIKFSIKNPNSLGIIRLSGQWRESTDSSIIAEAGAGYIVLESFGNYHVPSSVAEMFIDILVESTITFKAMSRSEHGYDYVRVFGITGEIIFNGQNISTFTEFTVSGKGTIRVQYIKDGSSNTEPDKGFLAVPEDFMIED